MAPGVLISLHDSLSNLIVASDGLHAVRKGATRAEVFENRRQKPKRLPPDARQTIDLAREFGQSLVSVSQEALCFSEVVAQDLREH